MQGKGQVVVGRAAVRSQRQVAVEVAPSDLDRVVPELRGPLAQSTLGLISYPTVRVGVTGHRELPDDPELIERIGHALERVRELAQLRPHTPAHLVAVSPLAEGADRLLACAVLRDPNGALEVPLPLPRDDYVADFPESIEDFDRLLHQATVVIPLPACETRAEAYEQVGRYVVKHCDVLIALWDGQPSRGRGGTAEIVEFARAQQVPLFWIKTQPPFPYEEERIEELHAAMKRVETELEQGARILDQLDHYNALETTELLQDEIKEQDARWAANCREAGFEPEALQVVFRWIMPKLIRADLLAVQEQSWFRGLGVLVFVLPFFAVVLAAIEALADNETSGWEAVLSGLYGGLVGLGASVLILALVLPIMDRRRKREARWISARFLASHRRTLILPAAAVVAGAVAVIPAAVQLTLEHARGAVVSGFLGGAEVSLLLLTLGFLLLGRRTKPYEWYVAARFLAEHFRPRLFLALLGEESSSNATERIYLESQSETWLKTALDVVWCQRPIRDPAALRMRDGGDSIEGLKQLLCKVWIEDQIGYHQKAHDDNRRPHELIDRLSASILVAVPVIALVHWIAFGLSPLTKILVGGGIVLPALAAALQGISVQREYERNANRYEKMVQHLKRRKEVLGCATTLDNVRAVAWDTEALMMHENREWFMVMQTHSVDR